MKFSIVTVTFNCCDFLEETIESVITQTFSDYEYIIIDACSTDGTLNIIKKYEQNISYWISETDNGIYDGMNKAIKVAKGDYIIFMNAGDSFYDDHVLQKVSDEIEDTIDVIFGDYISKTNKGNVYQHVTPFYESTKYLRQMGFCHQSVFVRTTLARNNMFDLSFRFCADYNMIYNLFCQNACFKQIDTPICYYDNTGGLTAKNPYYQTKEVARVIGIDKQIHFKLLNVLRLLKSKVKKVIQKK